MNKAWIMTTDPDHVKVITVSMMSTPAFCRYYGVYYVATY